MTDTLTTDEWRAYIARAQRIEKIRPPEVTRHAPYGVGSTNKARKLHHVNMARKADYSQMALKSAKARRSA